MKRLLMWAGVAAVLAAPVAAQDQAAEVMRQAREALGGAKLAEVNALSVEGPFAREMGGRQVQGKISLTLQLPGNMHRSEETDAMGRSFERASVLAGDTAWEEMPNGGGMGGGMGAGMRGGRQGAPGQEMNAERLEQARVRRLRAEMNRYLLAFLGGATLQPAYVAVAEAPEGKADVVEVKGEGGQAVRLFVDQKSHMPLMLQYQEIRPRMMMGGPGGPGGGRGAGQGRRGGARMGGGGEPASPDTPEAGAAPGEPAGAAGEASGQQRQRPNADQMRQRRENAGPPQPSTVTLFLSEFKKVDGIMLPHRLVQAVDGKTVEEWNIEKIKVNPKVSEGLFQRKN